MGSEVKTKLSYAVYLNLGLQSLAVFIICYYLLYLFTGLAVLYISYDFDIPAILYLDKITFLIDESSPLWTSDAMISILLARPISSFLVGFIAIASFILIVRKHTLHLFFSLWLFLLAFNMTFGLFSENIITQTGLIHVAQTMGIHSITLIFLVGLSLFLMIKAGLFSGKLLYSHCCTGAVSSREKILFGGSYLLFPWLAGSGIILVITGTKVEFKNIAMIIFMLVLIIPAMIAKAPCKEKIKMPVSNLLIWLIPLAAITTVATVLFLKNGFEL